MADENTFMQQFNGQLTGLMQWQQWDALRTRIGQGEWYVYAIGHGVPQTPSAGLNLLTQIDGIDAVLRREHDEAYLGIVYVDDMNDPQLVKIYDPNHLGTACSKGGSRIPPGWVISRHPPQAIASDVPVPASRKRWWSALLGKAVL